MIDAEVVGHVQDRLQHALPPDYLSLYGAARLQFGAGYDEWAEKWLDICLTAPPALVCSPPWASVEWMTLEESSAWQAPDNWLEGRYAAFADDGYGGSWCWWPERSVGPDMAVVLCHHDVNEAEVYGADFRAFVQRVMLEGFSYIADDTRQSFETETRLRRHLELCIDTVATCVGATWTARLRQMLWRKLQRSESDRDRWFLLEDDEVAHLLLVDGVMRGGGGDKFPHMRP